MQFNGHITKQDIVSDTYFEASTDSINYPIEDLTRNANIALDTAMGIIIGVNRKWQFDDSNYTTLPIGTTPLVSGQQDYTFDDEYLVIKTIECTDSSGKWYKLKPIDDYDEEISLSEFQRNNNGVPMYYDKMGESILLYPTPNYSISLNDTPEGGLRAYFQRKTSHFAIDDTTKEPGFASHLHKYIVLSCAYAFCCAKGIYPKADKLEKRIEYYEGNKLRGGNDAGAIATFYAYREQDNVDAITNTTIYSC